MKTDTLTFVLLALAFFFAGGSLYLASTLPEDCLDVCGPVIEVHHLNTFRLFSASNIPDGDYYYGPEIAYDDGVWVIPGKYESDVNPGYQITDRNQGFPPGVQIPYYTPDIEIKEDKLFFDAVVYNNAGYDLSNVTFDVVLEVGIKKNPEGAYGRYNGYDPDQWQESIKIDNIRNNSSKEIRIHAPLFPVKSPESIDVDVSLVFPEELIADDGTLLKYDQSEYILPETIPDVYDARRPDDQRNIIRVFGYRIAPQDLPNPD